MINANGISLLRRFAALFLALALCAGPLASLAAQPQNPVDFILSWQADDGSALTSTAVPVPYAEFPNSYWLYADQQAVQKDAVLSAIDNFSQYPGGFSIANGQPLSLLIPPDAGLSPAAENAVQVDAYDAQGNILMSYWLFVSLQTPEPQPPVATEPPAAVIDTTVTVNYLNVADGQPVASPTAQYFNAAGAYTIYPQPSDLQEGYLPAAGYPTEVGIEVNEITGNISVDFYYELPAPVAQPADITVRYIDRDNGQDIAPTQTKTLQPGETMVYPELIVIPEGYQPLDVEPRLVTVDMNGANPSVVEFAYIKNEPVIDTTVTINYLNLADGQPVASPTAQYFNAAGAYTIYPQASDLQEGYLPAAGYPTEQGIEVNESTGNISVDFYYELPAPVAQPADITVRYIDRDNGQDIAPSQTKTLQPGETMVYPELAMIPEGYEALDVEPRLVTVDMDGANPPVVEFIYGKAAPVIDTTVTVNYLNVADGQPVASPTAQYFNAAGAYTIYPQPSDLQEGYLPAAGYPAEVGIEVNESTGNISVDFYYELPAPVAQPADITVRYIDRDNGQDIAPTQTKTLQPGETMVYPELAMIPDGYEALDVEPRLVTVDINGANPPVVEFIYSKAVPAPVNDAAITIYFEDENGDPVADPIQRIYSAGEHLIQGEIIEGWELTDSTPVVLTVDASGANPGEIRFTYRPLIAPSVDITVNYLDAAGNPLLPAGAQTVHDGMNSIEAQPIEGYRVVGESTQYVRVTMDGADQHSITFVYESTAGEPVETTPPAAPLVDFIDVFYKDQYGNIIYQINAKIVEGEETIVDVDLGQVNLDIYEFTDTQSRKTATIDAQGNKNPSEIVFLFTRKPAQLILRYQTEAGEDIAEATQVPLSQLGLNTISAPENINEAYELISPEGREAELRQDGTVVPSEIIFLYRLKETVQPQPSAEPEVTVWESTPVENVYVHPYQDNVNVRSTPSAPSGDTSNVVGQVMKDEVIVPLGILIGDDQSEWYEIEFQDDQAFIKKSVTEPLDAKELEALGIEIPAEPETAETILPAEDMTVNLWGETNAAQVKFRDAAGREGKEITSLKQGTQVWVLAQTINSKDELWYEVIINGTAGFIKAEFVTLYDQQKSDSISASLPTPPPPKPTPEPSQAPVTEAPTEAPVEEPTAEPTVAPPTEAPQTQAPTEAPMTEQPTQIPAEATAVPTVEPTVVPTAAPTAEPVITPSPAPQATNVPAPYLGYLLTVQQAALRTDTNTQDGTILVTLPANTLLKAIAQFYMPDGTAWHHVDVYSGQSSGQSGYVPDSAVRRISQTDADQYIKPAVTDVPVVTAPPAQITGYGRTLGDNVLLREYPDSNAKISKIFPKDTTLLVHGQEYAGGVAWHLISNNGLYGFIRADQLRMLSAQESADYINSLRRTEPPVQRTPEPITPNSLSSYGYINADKVRLRREASASSSILKMMDRNAFALVLDSVKTTDGTDWYRINQNGTDGYVMGRYLTVLKLGELQQFLQSNDFRSGNNTGSTSSGGNTSITPVEDHNKTVWQNPNIQASYEPFNPIATATPPVEAIMSPIPSTTNGSFVVEASSSIDPLATFEPMGTDVPVKTSSGSISAWIAVGILGVLGGGGYYGWRLYQENQRKAAQRAAQRRQQAARQPGSPTATASTQGRPVPQTRPAGTQPRPGQSAQPGSPYTPPVAGQAQGTTAYQPPRPGQPGQVPPAPGGTTAYRPVNPQQPMGTPPTQGGTTAYRPVTPQQPMETPQAQGGTTAYRPVNPQQPMGTPPAQGGTAASRPGQANGTAEKPAQNGRNGQTAQNPADKPQTNGEGSRRRRTDRHSGGDKA